MKKSFFQIPNELLCFFILLALLMNGICFLGVRVAATEPGGGLADSAWPCKGHDPQRTGQSPYIGAQSNNLKWSYQTGHWVGSSPAIDVDGTVYIGSKDGKVYALNASGSLKWSYQTGGGVGSSPAIGVNGTIYFGSGDGKFYALDSNGIPKWSYQTKSVSGIDSSPIIGDDGTIYIGSRDNMIYALSSNGRLRWSYQTGGWVDSPPSIGADGTIYLGSRDFKIYALTSDGKLKWSFKTGNAIHSAPAIDTDGTIYIGSKDGNLYAFNPNGSLKWIYQTGNEIVSSPAIGADKAIYIGSNDGKVYALNLNGSLKWSYQIGNEIVSSPAIGADNTIYIGGVDGKVYALSLDGSLKWIYQTGARIHSSPTIGGDGTVYIGSYDCKVYAFGGDQHCYPDADGDGYGNPQQILEAFPCPAGYVANGNDCADLDSSLYPGTTELCDGKDNDCDGQVDEKFAVGEVCTAGIGACKTEGIMVCIADGTGSECIAQAGEPGIEVCDGEDNNCDGQTDEDGAYGCTTYYKDKDKDGFGVSKDSLCLCVPDPVAKYTSTRPGDPDDGNDLVPAVYQLFRATIKATGQSAPGALGESKVIIGCDEAVDTLLAPPLPPDYTVSVKLRDSLENTNYLYQDIRQMGSEEEKWIVMADIGDSADPQSPGYYPELSWDSSELGMRGYFRLWSSNSEGELLSLLVKDMRSVLSYQIKEGDSRYFGLTWSENLRVNLDLPAGWSMVSLPVLPESLVAKDLFPQAKAIYTFDHEYRAVYKDEELEAGIGYWIYLSKATSYTLAGLPIESYTLSAEGGWLMIGSCTYPALPPENSNSIESIYGYQGTYQLLGSEQYLEPGQGYWIYLTEQTQLRVESTGFISAKTGEPDNVTLQRERMNTLSQNADAGWRLAIRATGQEVADASSLSEVVIGALENGETASAPPSPPAYTLYLKLQDASRKTRYRYQDIRPIGTDHETWILKVEINTDYADPTLPGYYPLLSWDPEGVPCGMKLIRGQTEDGEVLVADMSQAGSYQTEEAGGESFLWFTLVMDTAGSDTDCSSGSSERKMTGYNLPGSLPWSWIPQISLSVPNRSAYLEVFPVLTFPLIPSLYYRANSPFEAWALWLWNPDPAPRVYLYGYDQYINPAPHYYFDGSFIDNSNIGNNYKYPKE